MKTDVREALVLVSDKAGFHYKYVTGVGQVLSNLHDPEECAGRHCVIHNPSNHIMRSWKTNFRFDKGQMERICPAHGIGHPDPDDLAFHESRGRDWMSVHGCCGCCHGSTNLNWMGGRVDGSKNHL